MLDSAFSRPAVLVTDAGNVPQTAPDSRAQRDGELVDALMATLRSNGALPPPMPLCGTLACCSPSTCKFCAGTVLLPLHLVLHPETMVPSPVLPNLCTHQQKGVHDRPSTYPYYSLPYIFPTSP